MVMRRQGIPTPNTASTSIPRSKHAIRFPKDDIAFNAEQIEGLSDL
jgi:hypothetical protein